MTTVAELKAAKQAGREAHARGEVPSHHPQQGGGELYEAWYDGWDEANEEANDRDSLVLLHDDENPDFWIGG